MPGGLVKRATYASEFYELTRRLYTFVPYASGRTCSFAAFICLLAVRSMRFVLWVRSTHGQARPYDYSNGCRSPITSSCGSMLCSHCFHCFRRHGAPALTDWPVLVIVGLLLLCLFSLGRREKEAGGGADCGVLNLSVDRNNLGHLHNHIRRITPWSPHMIACSGDPVRNGSCMASTALQATGSSRLSAFPPFHSRRTPECHRRRD